MNKDHKVYFVLLMLLLIVHSVFILSYDILLVEAQLQGSATNAVNQICNIVQNNGLLAALTGFGEALAICTGLDALSSNQALDQLCSAINSLGISGTESICRNQGMNLNETQQLNNPSDPNNTGGQSNSIIGNVLRLLS